MGDTVVNYLIQTQDEVRAQVGSVNPWEYSIFKELVSFSADKRGELGERWVSDWIGASDIEVIDDVTTKTNFGEAFDMIIEGDVKVEIKTAYRGLSNSWQHENLYKLGCCAYVVFVDVDYTSIYLSIVEMEHIPFDARNAMFGKKATLRQGRSDGYKLDFSPTTIKNLTKAGKTLTIDPNTTTNEEISSFISKSFKGGI